MKGHSSYGFIGHNLEKEVIISNYFPNFIDEYIVVSTGIFLWLLLPIGVGFGCYTFIKKTYQPSFVTGLAYSFPWIFLC